MISQTLDVLRITKNGSVDWWRVVFTGVPVLIFIVWRISSVGIYGAENVMESMAIEIIDDYKQALYKAYGFYEDGDLDPKLAAQFPAEELVDLKVEFENVSMSAPLLSWGAKENFGLRFDYTLKQNGITKKQGENVYKFVSRRFGVDLVDSGPVRYYSNYIL